ncbi:uncharacterized protein LOC134830997 isoform X2 [Culicoides brevitarsis]|uniref:uncharacterized protein LOC134830997 isoform X2 n=1 Tax=Culicoides brevitarsis TaxID=469753 RepID=UPI00307BD52F
MQSNIKINNNESFKLLNFSDDDKSSDLPDLDLPEISLQRKRKVKRKTRSRTPAKHVNHGRESPCFQCKSFGLWAAVLMICSWLLIISYISSVVHAEYRRLEIELQKVSATSQHVPEALQKWHETSKALEQNQTTLSEHIQEIQSSLKSFKTQITKLSEKLDEKNADSQTNQILSLQTNIATFGSQITAFTGQIEKLSSDYADLKENQKHFNDTVLEIRANFEATKNLTLPTVADNATRTKLDTFIRSIEDRFNNLSQRVNTENETLIASLKWFEDDLKNKTVKLNELSDNFLNISSHVYSVENLYTTNLSKQFESLQSASTTLNATVQKHELLYETQLETMKRQINEIQKRLDATVAASAKIDTVIQSKKDDQLDKIFSSSGSNANTNNKNNEPVIPSSGSQKQSSDNIDKNNILSSDKNKSNASVASATATTQAGAPKNILNSTFPEGLMQN